MEIKKCPFCGEKIEELDITIHEYTGCSSHISTRYDVSCCNEKCHVNPTTIEFSTEKQAIAAWNKRVS